MRFFIKMIVFMSLPVMATEGSITAEPSLSIGEESYQRRQEERMSRQVQQFIDKAIAQGFFDPEVITFTTEVK